ncbi:MAG: tetratricopeptide repeat protein [Polyangiaceae bacterium]
MAVASLTIDLEVRADDGQAAATAQSLFDAGRELLTAGRHEEAYAKFEESFRIDPSAGTLLNMGQCLEGMGKIASAWATYKRAVSLGKTKNQPRQVTAGEQLAAALEPRLPKVVVTVEKPVPGLVVKHGDVSMGEASWGVPTAIDPGKIEIRAEAPDYEPWSTTLEFEEGATVPITVPALVARPKKHEENPPVVPVTPDGSRDALLYSGIAIGGLGIAALAVGATFGALTLADASTARDDPTLCPNDRCTAAGLDFIEAARVKAAVSTGTLVGGGVLAAAGIVLVSIGVTREPASTKREGILMFPIVGSSSFGIGVLGTWENP